MTDHLTPRAAAQRLGVSTRTLRRYVAAGMLEPASRTPGGHGRFDPAELDALRGSDDLAGSIVRTAHLVPPSASELREAGTRLPEPDDA